MSISNLCKSGTPRDNNSWSSSGSSVLDQSNAASVPTLSRLLYVATTKSQGGIETHSVEMAAALQEHGVHVRFACRQGSFVEAWCRQTGISSSEFRVHNSGDLGAALRLARIIQNECIDIVHIHSRRDYVVGVLGTALARRLCCRQVGLVLHAHMVRPLGEPAKLSGQFFEWGADAVAAVSSTVCDLLRCNHQFNPALVHLIPNGVKMENFALSGSPEAARRRAVTRQALGIADEAVVLGMIGRLDAKGQRQLFQVIPRLLPSCPHLRLVIVGSEGKPNEQAALTALARAGGFEDRVVFTGPRSDIPTLLPAFDVLVHLPIDEAFGLALAEAMAAGLPTVATAIGGCSEVVRDGLTGRLVPPGDPDALLTALCEMVDPVQGADRRSEMGAAGYRIVQAEFSQEMQISRLLTLYHEICPLPSL